MIGRRDRGEPDSRARLVMLQAPEGAAANAYRLALTTVLPDEHAADAPRRMMVVAVDASADGPIATANLAVAAAATGARTVLVDCNLRRPRLHALLGVENVRGLSTIAGGSEPAGCLVPTDVAGLAVLPAGPSSSGGVDVLARQNVSDAVKAATTDADLVLISCAPFSEGPDAILVSRWIDTAILVLSGRGTRRADGTRAKEQLERAGVHILGAIFFRDGPGAR